MRSLTEFREQKRALLCGYSDVLDAGLLPIGAIDKNEFLQKRSLLENERFVVAVCGQIKSGKSTLLNALVFGDAVLPVDDTVATAKVTVLRFRETPGFIVDFYTREEWNHLKDNLANRPHDLLEFNRQTEIAAASEEPEFDYITIDGKSYEEPGWENLRKFVAVVDKGGVCSPYVKSVTVFHTNQDFSDVEVVDTPGVNDPNKVRDAITKHWIHNASAVVFVTYANAAMAEADVDFVDRYLLGVPRNRRLLAVNRMDKPGLDRVGVRAYIDRLRRNDDPRIRGAIADEGATAYVSSFGALMGEADRRGVRLPRQFEEYRAFMEASEIDWLDATANGFTELRRLIEERLLANKAEGLIEVHRGFLESIFERHRKKNTVNMSDIEAKRILFEESNEENQARRRALDEGLGSLEGIRSEMGAALKDSIELVVHSLRHEVMECKSAVICDFRKSLNSIHSVNVLSLEGLWFLQESFEAHSSEIDEVMRRCRREAISAFELRWRSYEPQLVSLGVFSDLQIREVLKSSPYEAILQVEQHFRDALSTDRLKILVKEATSFWQRIFSTDRGLEISRARVFSEVEDILHRQFSDLVKTLVDNLYDLGTRSLSRMETALDERIGDQRKHLELLAANSSSREHELEMIKKEEERVNQKIIRVDRLAEQIGFGTLRENFPD